jgi:hypothetical protein
VRIGISKLNFIELDLSVGKGREMQAGLTFEITLAY